MSISVLELPLTQRERELVEPPSAEEHQQALDVAIGKAASDFNDAELGDVCAVAFENIVDLIAANDAEGLGQYVMFLRRQRIADLASRAVYGRLGQVFASQVKV